MVTNQIISARVLALMAQGLSPIDALKQVCGSVVVDAMIADLYAALRAKADTK